VLLSTRLGPLDCLGTLIDGRGFEELVSHSESIKDEGAEFAQKQNRASQGPPHAAGSRRIGGAAG
jgi:hypothetical protein